MSTRPSLMDLMAVDVPEGASGQVSIERFEITRDRADFMSIRDGYRAPRPGTYTRLIRSGSLWMSDTTAERRDHLSPLLEIQRREARRVLIGGLGLGMVIKAALAFDHVEQIDVIEIDPDVIALVAPHYEATGRVTVHEADVYEKKWTPGTRWDVAWWDIWRDLCTDNLTEMARLHRSYGRRVDWQGSWGKEILRYERRRQGSWWA